jgi:hypothetical protein
LLDAVQCHRRHRLAAAAAIDIDPGNAHGAHIGKGHGFDVWSWQHGLAVFDQEIQGEGSKVQTSWINEMMAIMAYWVMENLSESDRLSNLNMAERLATLR